MDIRIPFQVHFLSSYLQKRLSFITYLIYLICNSIFRWNIEATSSSDELLCVQKIYTYTYYCIFLRTPVMYMARQSHLLNRKFQGFTLQQKALRYFLLLCLHFVCAMIYKRFKFLCILSVNPFLVSGIRRYSMILNTWGDYKSIYSIEFFDEDINHPLKNTLNALYMCYFNKNILRKKSD